MKKGLENTGGILIICLCVGLGILYAFCQRMGNAPKEVKKEKTLQMVQTVQKLLPEDADGTGQEAEKENEVFSPENQLKINEEEFYAEAKKQKVEANLAEELFGRLMEDGIFRKGAMALTGLVIDDIDENVEIVFSAQGTGCGAAGDSYKAVFKYKNHAIERMELPLDLEEDYDSGLRVELIQEPEADRYSAYCPYFNEKISFRGKNIEGWELPDTAQVTGGNVRGFFNLYPAEYGGETVLQASEYLHGEGGIAHCVAIVHFLIAWEGNGQPKVIKWWIEEGNTWANSRESRICYEDGFYYYASQLDHYYLYRAAEDGGEAECLAKVHPGSICVWDDEIYFINLSDGPGSICRMKTDGSGMEKLCETGSESQLRLCDEGRKVQLSAEYVYFCSIYEEEYDKAGLVTEAPSEFDSGFLYRMKRDGSDRELIARDVWQYVLSDGNSQKVWYTGSIYCTKWVENQMVVYRMDLDGKNETELCRFDDRGKIMVYGNSVFYAGDFYGDREKVSRYHFENGEVSSFAVPEYTDCCIYKGYFYGLNEEKDENGQKVTIYRIDFDGEEYEALYEGSFSCEYSEGGYLSDIYASGEGVFFRTFVSDQEGCRWFRLAEEDEAGVQEAAENGDVKSDVQKMAEGEGAKAGGWKAEEWEDAGNIPVALPAQSIEYGEMRSVMSVLENTEGYEEYLAKSLEYKEYYGEDEDGKGYNLYWVNMPQFNSKIAGYEKINQYFQKAYEDAVKGKEDFFDMLGEEDDLSRINWYQWEVYNYVYIGENYITVAVCREGYWGGIRSWITPKPITFERESGKKVSLEEIMGMKEREATANLTGSVYKYMEGIGRGTFLLKEKDVLTENYDPEQFFLFPEGIGIYFGRYAIDCGAAGDYMFVVPWEEIQHFP